MPTSLLDYVSARSGPSPLPPQSARRSRRDSGIVRPGPWPVDLLPADAIAVELARRGLTFRRGTGYAVHGAYVEPDQASKLAIDVLDLAVATLDPSRVADLAALGEEIEIALHDGYWEAQDLDLPEEALAGHVDSLPIVKSAHLLPVIYAATVDTSADELTAAEQSALQHTADDLRTSKSARERLL